MKKFLYAVIAGTLLVCATPSLAVTATFQVSGTAPDGKTYTSVTVNTDKGTIRYNCTDGLGYTVWVQDVWEFYRYYAGREAMTMTGD